MQSSKSKTVKKQTAAELLEEMESLIEIDENNLDRECVNQAKYFLYFATKLADAKLNHAEAKAAVELTEAELAQGIRAQPSRFGVSKVTEGVIKEVVVSNPAYQDALKKMNFRKHKVDLLQGMTEALEHRKRGLEGAITLFGQGYNAAPRVRGEVGKNAEKTMIRNRGRMEK